MKIIYQILIFLSLCLSGQVFAQNSRIRPDRACINCPTEEPHSSAVLDIQANDRGILIPRLANTAAVVAPAEGLMIYDNSSNNYKYYNGSTWQTLGSGEAVDYRDFYDYVCTNPQDYQMSVDLFTEEDCGTLYDSGGAMGNYGNNEEEIFNINHGVYDNLFTRIIIHSLDIEEGVDTLFIEDMAFTQNRTTPIELFFNGDDIITIRFVSNGSNIGGPYDGFHLSWDISVYQGGNSVNETGLGFFYNAEKQAIGGGVELNSAWSNIGVRSLLFGYGGKAAGNYSTSIGYSNDVSGNDNTVLGNLNDVPKNDNIVLGSLNEVTRNGNSILGNSNNVNGGKSSVLGNLNDINGNLDCIAIGGLNDVDGNRGVALGNNLISDSYSMVAIGSYNLESNGSANIWIPGHPIFVVGNGQDGALRSNAMTILKNGKVGIGITTPDELLHVDGKIKLGSGETFEDAGLNRIATNSHFVPLFDNLRDLGHFNNRWNEVWAADGTINTSDARDKRNIEDLEYGLAEVLDLRPVRFQWKGEKTGEEKLGLLAQDLLKVLPEVVKSHDWVQVEEDSEELKKVALERYGVFYSDLIPVLIRAIQEQQEEIEELKDDFENRLANLEEQLALMQQNCCTSTLDIENRNASLLGTAEQAQLLQNEPNPFDQSTTIRYFIPNEVQQAHLQISDLTGKVVRQVNVKERGAGSYKLNAYSLQAGSYFYTLVVDGQVLETKQMVVLK